MREQELIPCWNKSSSMEVVGMCISKNSDLDCFQAHPPAAFSSTASLGIPETHHSSRKLRPGLGLGSARVQSYSWKLTDVHGNLNVVSGSTRSKAEPCNSSREPAELRSSSKPETFVERQTEAPAESSCEKCFKLPLLEVSFKLYLLHGSKFTCIYTARV